MPAKAEQLERHLDRVERWSAWRRSPNGRTDNAEPETDSGASEQLMRQGFGSYGRYWVESFRMPYVTDRELDRGFSFIGYSKLEEVRAAGFGPIVVLPHLGGWEWAAAWLGRIAKVQVTAVVERLEPEEVFLWFSRLRQAYGVNVVPLGPRAMVELAAAVKRTDIICLLADRDIGANGVEVDFFGERTTVPAGPALLARRTGAPLVPTAVFFRDRQRVTVVGDPIWPGDDPSTARGRAATGSLMQRVVSNLEELVAQAPDQWHLLEPNWPSDHRDRR
jgi:KDO2-lipid IV(A) lauroyltransferase